ncbi:hypothetical protein K7A42_08445 [Agrobacterium sp. InxBP2]|nr:hypothetical protein [Agrobacterium sp. InxBP2]
MSGRDDLAKRARKVDDPLKLVIVRDMWLTGFDAPCMHTMYIDKPMRGHGLIQAIARVNRVFKEKPDGLVVDYIGIATNLKKALAQYSQSDRDKTGIDEEEAVAVLLEKYEIVRGMFTGHDYSLGCHGQAYRAAEGAGRRHRLDLEVAAGGSSKSRKPRGQEAGASPISGCGFGAEQGLCPCLRQRCGNGNS